MSLNFDRNIYKEMEKQSPMFVHVLREPAGSGIESWEWNLKGDNSTYHALYPRAWTVYEGNLHLQVVCIHLRLL
jgi:uncharacterized protein (DUF608 family)